MFVEQIHLENHGPTMANLKLDGFKPITVVYGRNGVGKTLISDVFRAIENRGQLEPGSARISLGRTAQGLANEGVLEVAPFPSVDLSRHVRAFNRRFIDENVIADDANPASIVLGSDNQELKDRIDAKASELVKIGHQVEKLSEDKKRYEKDLESAQRSAAKEVSDITTLAPASARNQSMRRGIYSVQHVRNMDEEWDLDGNVDDSRQSESDLTTLSNALTNSKPRIKRPDLVEPPIDELYESAKSLLNAVPLVSPLPEAEGKPKLRDWLHKGRSYIGPKDRCGFCTNRVPPDRKDDLNAAFTGEYDDLQNKLRCLRKGVKAAKTTFGAIPDCRDIAAVHQKRYEEVGEEYDALIVLARTDLDALFNAVESKVADPMCTVELPRREFAHRAWDDVIRRLGQIFDDHDDTVGDMARVRDEFVAGTFAEGYPGRKRIRDSIAVTNRGLSEHREAARAIERELAQLRREASSRRRAAEALTAEVQDFLGHREFAFELDERDESSFVITRDGKQAIGLSEGETSALGLLYFLNGLDDTDFDRENGVVVIDDPVTSFDDVNLHRAYAAVLHRVQRSGAGTNAGPQFIMLTHHVRLMQRMYLALKYRQRHKKDVAFKHLKIDGSNDHRVARWESFDYGTAFRDPYQRAFNRVVRISKGGMASDGPERPIRVCLESFVDLVAPKAAANGLGAAIETIRNQYFQEFDHDPLDEQEWLELMDFANAEEHPGEVTDADARVRDLQRTATSVLKIMEAGAPMQLLDMKR